jgi:hypothetical protein
VLEELPIIACDPKFFALGAIATASTTRFLKPDFNIISLELV